MSKQGRTHRLRLAVSALLAPVLLTALGGTAAAQPPTVPPSAPAAAPAPAPAAHADASPYKLPVAPPKVTPPAPLPKPRAALVPSTPTKIAGPGAAPQRAGRSTAAAPNAAVAPTTAAPNAAVAPNAAAATVVADPNKVGVRALVLAVGADDFGAATWRSMLDRVGATYDVVNTKDVAVTSETLIRPDGGGRYNAILLTDGMLLYQDGTGAYVSGLSADEWNLVWAYERDYKVRQVALYASYGTFPEDYCLRAGTEGGVGDTPLNATLTTAGRAVFTDLKATAQIPIVQSYVYRDTLQAGCNAQAILSAGSAVLGVQSTSTDGRERIALTFSSNQYLLQANLLTYGLFRWATKGLYLGDQRHYLGVDVDDWFNSTDEMSETGVLNSNPGFSMTAHDAYNARTQQSALRTRYPLAGGFTMSMAFNGGDAATTSTTTCSPNGNAAQLTSTSRCIRNDVRWINHTFTHPEMNKTDYATSLAEINNNLTRAQALGLPTDRTILKTGEYSGLGVYNPNPDDDVDPPTDFGLAAANPNLLKAAKDAGVKYFHGNMSFASHQPKCFNCVTTFPQAEGAGLAIVPDWPTNIAYFSTTPAEETYFYNSYYGPNGKFPFWPTNRTYTQILDSEAEQALGHIASGSIYVHTFHIGNLRDYGAGKTLTTDWLDRTMARYSALYAVPLLSPAWPDLAATAANRNAHFAARTAGVDAVYNRATNSVTVTSPAAGKVVMSGARTAGFTTYGTEVSATITLAANTPVTFTPSLRS